MPPALIGGAIAGIGSIAGGLLGSSASKSATNAQVKSDAAAIAEQKRQYDLSRSDFAPYLGAGTKALPGIMDLLGLNGQDKGMAAINALKSSPEYQSLYANGEEALLQNAAATGGLRGGNTQRGLADFGRDTLSTLIGQQLSRLGGLAGLGVGATDSIAGLGQNTANNISALTQAQGNARASGALAQGGIWSGVANNLSSILPSMLFPSTFKGF